jgi:hypothetical protein
MFLQEPFSIHSFIRKIINSVDAISFTQFSIINILKWSRNLSENLC